jgi:hypothetical protein
MSKSNITSFRIDQKYFNHFINTTTDATTISDDDDKSLMEVTSSAETTFEGGSGRFHLKGHNPSWIFNLHKYNEPDEEIPMISSNLLKCEVDLFKILVERKLINIE